MYIRNNRVLNSWWTGVAQTFRRDVESGILIINFRGEIETLVGFDVRVVHGSWAVRLKRMDGWFNGKIAAYLSFMGIDLDSRVFPFRLLIVAFDDRC